MPSMTVAAPTTAQQQAGASSAAQAHQATTSAAVITDRVHVRFTTELSPSISAKERLEKVEELSKLLVALRDVARGRPLVDWDAVVDVKRPSESAAACLNILQRYPAHTQSSIAAIATRIVTPGHLAIVAALEEPFRARIRDDVLQAVLKGLTTSGEEAMPVCAEMMVEMLRLELVLIKGVATTLDTLLRDRSTRRAATAVIGRLAEQYSQTRSDGLLHTVSHVRSTLRELQGDPAYEYDINAVQRFMGWRPATQPSLVHCRSLPAIHKQITSSTYFAGRDELVTGGSERTIAVWGSLTQGDSPSASFQLPTATVPVSMDASTKGNLLAVGCVSTAKPGVLSSCVQAYVCSDNSGAWSAGETLRRPERSVITQVKCLATKGNVMCIAESTTAGAEDPSGGSSPQQHQIVLFGASGSESRKLSRAHQDYITVIAASPDNDNLLLSGSRDTTVKLWDTRGGSSSSSATLEGHTDTITSIVTIRDIVISTSFDGKLKLWDMRRLKSELDQKVFTAPVLKAASTTNATAVVTTLQGLHLLSLFPMQLEDVIPNVVYNDLKVNHDGTVIFASMNSTTDVYTIHGHHHHHGVNTSGGGK